MNSEDNEKSLTPEQIIFRCQEIIKTIEENPYPGSEGRIAKMLRVIELAKNHFTLPTITLASILEIVNKEKTPAPSLSLTEKIKALATVPDTDLFKPKQDGRSKTRGITSPPKDKQAVYRQSRVEKKLCPRCGKPPETERVLCNSCREKKNNYFGRKIADHNNNEDFLLSNSILALEKLGFLSDPEQWTDTHGTEIKIHNYAISPLPNCSIVVNFMYEDDLLVSQRVFLFYGDEEIPLHTDRLSHIKVLLKMLKPENE